MEEDDKVPMLLNNLDKVPRLKAIVVYDPFSKIKEDTSDSAKVKVFKWDTFMKWSRALKNDAELKERMGKV